MSESPQTPPAAPALGLTLDRQEIRSIAVRQKAILLCVLANVVAYALRLLLQPSLHPILNIVVLAVGVVASVFLYMLAIKLYGTGVGILLGILTLVPLLGLFVLLIVNGKATRTLKESGIKVGLLGADLSTI